MIKTPCFKLDPLAAERWEAYYRHLHDINDPYVTRLDTHGLRLAPLLAANDIKSTVDAETVDKVVALLDWQYQVRREHDPIDAEGEVARMEQRLRRCWNENPQRGFKRWELQPRVNYKRYGVWVFKQALNNARILVSLSLPCHHSDNEKKLIISNIYIYIVKKL